MLAARVKRRPVVLCVVLQNYFHFYLTGGEISKLRLGFIIFMSVLKGKLVENF